MFKDMQKWIEIRRRVLNREISKRQACQEYGLGLSRGAERVNLFETAASGN